jgi:hypothetical protein
MATGETCHNSHDKRSAPFALLLHGYSYSGHYCLKLKEEIGKRLRRKKRVGKHLMLVAQDLPRPIQFKG